MIFLCHYAGWPNGARLNSIVEDTIAKGRAARPVTTFEELDGGSGLLSARPGPDLAARGYAESEYVVRGTAVVLRRPRARPAFATPGRRTPSRPRPGSFSGTVVVEWLNVSSGSDAAPDWTYLADEIVRRGHAWVGVSAQHVGVEGGDAVVRVAGVAPTGLKAPRALRRAEPPRRRLLLLDLRLRRGRPATRGRWPTWSSTSGWRWGSRSRPTR